MPRGRQHVFHGLVGSLLLLLMMLVPAVGGALPGATAATTAATAAALSQAARAEDETALSVEIKSLTPTALPASGRVEVIGTVTNNDAVDWLDVGIYPLIGNRPITTQAELDAANNLPSTAEVGQRILIVGDYTKVDRIVAGATIQFRLSIPRGDLTKLGVTSAGVYWFGVHALGSGPNGSDDVADGRARTFLPLMPTGSSTTPSTPIETSIVVPIRASVLYDGNGAVAEERRWTQLLQPGGRLARLADLAAADPGDISWLVDPAVLDAVEQLADGNPVRSLEETDQADPPAEPPTEPEPSASASAEARSSTTAPALPELAARWQETITAALTKGTILVLPYGDLDLTAAAAYDTSSYTVARARSTAAMTRWGLSGTSVNAPVAGVLDEATAALLSEVDSSSPVLIRSDLLAEGITTDRVQAGDLTLVAYDAEVSAGGPGPTEPLSAVALRQRIAAEAALLSLSGSKEPLLVSLPPRWSVTDSAELTRGLRQPWLTPSPFTVMAGSSVTEVKAGEAVTVPEGANARALSSSHFNAAARLIRAGRTLGNVVADENQLADATTDQALVGLSFHRRGKSTVPAVANRTAIEALLSSIRIQAPRAVTLSGASGRFATTVTNDLPVTVTVTVKPVTDDGIVIAQPKPITVAPGASSTIVLEADNAKVGVHQVRLLLTDSSGTRFGAPAEVPVRASQVSQIIWVFVAVGVGLLFAAIGLRLYRRVRATRSAQPSTDEVATDE